MNSVTHYNGNVLLMNIIANEVYTSHVLKDPWMRFQMSFIKKYFILKKFLMMGEA